MLATEAWNFWEMLFYGFMVSWFHGFMVLGLFHKLRTLVVNNSETISKDTLLNKWNRVRDLGRDRWKIDLAGVRRIMRCSGSMQLSDSIWKTMSENVRDSSDSDCMSQSLQILASPICSKHLQTLCSCHTTCLNACGAAQNMKEWVATLVWLHGSSKY